MCFLCHPNRASQAGKMISLPGGISVCSDCMQKSFDAMDNPEVRNMLNLQNFTDRKNFPDMGMIDLDFLREKMQSPKGVKKPKEKKEEEKAEGGFRHPFPSGPAPDQGGARRLRDRPGIREESNLRGSL